MSQARYAIIFQFVGIIVFVLGFLVYPYIMLLGVSIYGIGTLLRPHILSIIMFLVLTVIETELTGFLGYGYSGKLVGPGHIILLLMIVASSVKGIRQRRRI